MLRRFAGLPRSVFGTALAHLGLGLTTLGIVGTLCFGTEKILSMHAGETVELSGHTLRFEGLYPGQGPTSARTAAASPCLAPMATPIG